MSKLGKLLRRGKSIWPSGKMKQEFSKGIVLVIIVCLVFYFFFYDSHSRSKAILSGVSLSVLEADPSITVENVPDDLVVGVVVSYTEDTSEGAGWDKNGEGVSVARWRLEQGGTNIALAVVSDSGTDTGARSAVSKLAKENVGAIIAITSGDHCQALAQAAADAGIPIIFPYEPWFETEANAWFYNPSDADMAAIMVEYAVSLGCTNGFLISTNETFNAHVALAATKTEEFEVGASHVIQSLYEQSWKTKVLGKDVEYLEDSYEEYEGGLEDPDSACVLLDVSGADVAIIYMNSLKPIGKPVIATSEAQNYSFYEVMKDESKYNTYYGPLYSVGVIDNAALAEYVGFFSEANYAGLFNYALSLMLADESVVSLSSDGSFNDYGSYADLASHDALISIVMAAANANSSNPADIAMALGELVLDLESSPVSIALDFTSQDQPVRETGIVKASYIETETQNSDTKSRDTTTDMETQSSTTGMKTGITTCRFIWGKTQ